MEGLRDTLSRLFGLVLVLFALAIAVAVVWAIADTGQWSYAGALILALLIAGTGWPRLFPNVFAAYPVDRDDPIMRDAIARARRELGRLRTGVSEGRKEAYLKFPLKTANGDIEHIWGTVHSISSESAVVSLANEPIGEIDVSEDPRRTVHLSEAEDWMLVSSDGTTEGGYTHLAMARIVKRDKGRLPSAVRESLRTFKDIRDDEL